MIDNNTTIQPAKVRVSIFERIVPFAAMAMAAVGGAVGGLTIISLLNALRAAENAGIGAVAAALSESTVYMLIFLYGASVVGLVGVFVAIGRLMIETKTSSPSGISYIVLGILALVPAAIIWYAGGLILSVLNGTSTRNMGELGVSIGEYCLAAVIVTPVVLFVLLAWSLIPFKARHGRRFGPVACVVVAEVMLVAVTIAFQLRVFELYKIYQSAG